MGRESRGWTSRPDSNPELFGLGEPDTKSRLRLPAHALRAWLDAGIRPRAHLGGRSPLPCADVAGVREMSWPLKRYDEQMVCQRRAPTIAAHGRPGYCNGSRKPRRA